MAARIVVDDNATLLSVSVLEVAFHGAERAGDGELSRDRSAGAGVARSNHSVVTKDVYRH